MAVVAMWCGALTDTSIRVRGEIAGATGRLGIATSPLLTDLVYSDAEPADSFGWVNFTANGLNQNTDYWYIIEDAGVPDTATVGHFRTMPTQGQPASYTFACSSCAGDLDNVNGISNHEVFDTIRHLDPLFFSHLGDMHYKNITTNTPSLYRAGFDDVLAQSRQHQLYREVPFVYSWDDHDYANNNSDRLDPGRPAAAQVYRERVPSYALPDSLNIGCYQSFECGRVLFIASDCRSYRDPSTDPASSSKTMLGAAQKTWMENILANSTAEAFVWLNPTPWMGLAQDTWAGYTHERDELVAMFDQHGWLDRMVCLNGDYHGLAMDSGGGNDWGGFPVAIFGSLDSVLPGGGGTSQYDQGLTLPGNNQYGTVQIVDSITEMDIILRAFTGGAQIFSTTLHVDIAVEPPPDPEEPPPPAPPADHSVAVLSKRVTWLGCDLVSGSVLTELLDLSGSSISRILGAYTSTTLSLPIPRSGPAALGDISFQATEPGKSMIVAVVNSVPTWAGVVLTREGGVGATLDLGLVSLEGYYERRYVGDHEWTQQDEVSVIARGLALDGANQGINVLLDTPATGVKRDRLYLNNDDATVYSRLRELMGVENGPEWTIDVDWDDDFLKNTIRKTLRIRSRIGIASDTPSAVFTTRGQSSTTYKYKEDFTDGRGANYVQATSTGEGEDRPMSTPQTSVTTGWPRYDRRFSPSTSISEISTLNAHARQELALRKFGSRTIELEARWDATPRLNIDWRLGDDVAWDLVGHRHPNGYKGTGRVIGWELDMRAGLVRPILWDPNEGTS